MTYSQTIDYLYNQLPMFQSQGPGAYKPGLDTARTLAAAFGNPHASLRCIHVGGTNGKGSTAHTIAAVLQSAGYRVGLYTSPHLVDFRERIRIDGRMIPREDVCDFVERYRAMNLNCRPSFFELTTIMAFEHFARNHVDFAVIEVGLGGRLDTTNIITPVLSIITNISLDHVALLGDTPQQIAHEKAGIIKACVPVVIGEAEGEVRHVFAERAAQVHAPIVFADDTPVQYEKASDNTYIYNSEKWGRVHGELSGDCQPLNANTVMHALDLLSEKVPIPQQAVAEGFAHVNELTGLMGRWMRISDSPVTICDTGHNIGGWQYISRRLSVEAQQRTVHIVIGFVNDKDLTHIFPLLPRRGVVYHFVQPSVDRRLPVAALQQAALAQGISGDAYETVAQGYETACRQASPDDMIFVGGSTFVVADLLSSLSDDR